MKKTITLFLLMLSVSLTAQIQSNLPWAEKATKDNFSKKNTTTLEEYTANAEKHFETIDRNAKGSGYKPFKRWEHHWSYYLNDNGEITSREDLWKAWSQKNELSSKDEDNNGNWLPLGPYVNSNRYSAFDYKQTGGGRVNAIAVDPSNSNTIYVGSPAGGIWKSIDGGLQWNPLTDYLPQIGVSGIAIHPTDTDIIYIATGDDDAGDSNAVGVWKSTDGGTTWNNTADLPGRPKRMSEIYINPSQPETLLVATSTGVHKTTDGGTTWSRKLGVYTEDLKMKPNDSNTWYATSNGSFYKSTDGGDSFKRKTIDGLSNSGRIAMDVTAANPNYVYFVSAGPQSQRSPFNGIYKSTDSGETFTKTQEEDDIFNSSQAWYDLAITASSSNPEIVYVGVLDIWKSTDGGDDFSELNQWYDPNTTDYTHADIHFLRFIDGKFFAGTDGGIFVSEDEGVNFTDLSKNLSIHQFYRISVSQAKLDVIATGAQDNGGYGYTNNNWYNYHGGDGMEGVVDVNDPNKYYGFAQYGQTLTVTTDGGLNQSFRLSSPAAERGTNDNGGNWVTPMTMNSSGELYAGYGQLYKLENRSWKNVSGASAFGGDLDHIEFDPSDDDFVLVSRGSSGSLFRSFDKGSSFANIQDVGRRINSIEISNTDPNKAWIVTSNGVYYSSNIKSLLPSFTNITGNLPTEGKNVIKHHARSGNNTVYLGTNLGVYYTNDELEGEWKTFDNNLPNTQVIDMDINEEEGKLYAATYGRGVFSSDIAKIVPAKDLSLVSIRPPTNNLIGVAGNITPSIFVKNKGMETLNNVEIVYNFNGGTEKTYIWEGSIEPESEVEINLPEESLSIGNYVLNVISTTEGDAYSTNNNGKARFLINKFNASPNTVNSFETETDKLLSENGLWERGNVNKELLKTPTNSNAYATKLAGNHPDNTTGYLYTNYYDLTNISNPVLSFKMAFDIEENWDHMYVDYSTDNGTNWTILGTANDPNWYNSDTPFTEIQTPLPGKQWTGEGEDPNPLGGTNATVHNYSYDLSALNNESEIMFRFVFVADAFTNEEGAVIDDLVIEGVLSNNDVAMLNGISVSPNPSESIFNIQWQPDGEPMDIIIYDITGKKILSKKDIDNATFSIDMTKYTSGIYLLNMKSKGKSATKKLVLK